MSKLIKSDVDTLPIIQRDLKKEFKDIVKTIERLSSKGLSSYEIAKLYNISERELLEDEELVEIIRKNKIDFVEKVLQKQMKIAFDDNHREQSKMLLHYGRTLLNQSEMLNYQSLKNNDKVEKDKNNITVSAPNTTQGFQITILPSKTSSSLKSLKDIDYEDS
jgi:hypothetical protein